MRRNWNTLGILLAAVVISAPVWAHEECDEGETKVASAASGESVSPRFPAASKVTIKLFQFQPGRLQVNAGTTVNWVNDDEIFHTVTAEKKESGFDGPLDGKGKSFSFTFSQPGNYTYYCDRHEHMRGEIEVR
jgi:plastocyanin